MAIFRCELSHGSRKNSNSAKAKLNYITRQEKYEKQEDRCIHTESKLPLGFKGPAQFWELVDKKERKNGRLYSEFKLSLPLEHKKNINAQIEAVQDFINKTIPDQPYTFALHEGKGTNPHCHLIFSSRSIDEVHREQPGMFFMRANKKNPEKGGSAKNREIIKDTFLLTARENWASSVNEALTKNATIIQKITQKVPQVSHESRKKRGLTPAPAGHIKKAIKDKIKAGVENEICSDKKRYRRVREQTIEEVCSYALSTREYHKDCFKQSFGNDKDAKCNDKDAKCNDKDAHEGIKGTSRLKQHTNASINRALEDSTKLYTSRFRDSRARSLSLFRSYAKEIRIVREDAGIKSSRSQLEISRDGEKPAQSRKENEANRRVRELLEKLDVKRRYVIRCITNKLNDFLKRDSENRQDRAKIIGRGPERAALKSQEEQRRRTQAYYRSKPELPSQRQTQRVVMPSPRQDRQIGRGMGRGM